MDTHTFKKGDKVIVCATIDSLYDIGITNTVLAIHILSKAVIVFKVEYDKIYIVVNGDTWWVRPTWVKPATLPNGQMLLFDLV